VGSQQPLLQSQGAGKCPQRLGYWLGIMKLDSKMNTIVWATHPAPTPRPIYHPFNSLGHPLGARNSGWLGDEGRRTGIWTGFGNVARTRELAEREPQTESRRYSN
jgi:hypothetical protein